MTPPDTDEEIFISPSVAVSRDAFRPLSQPIPITMQHPTPQATPVTVDDLVLMLASIEGALRPLPFSEIGELRYALLDMNGVTDPSSVRAGSYDQTLENLLPELAEGALELARLTLDRLLAERDSSQPPIILHSDTMNVDRLVGQTLFWADHYITPDRIAEAAAERRDDLSSYRAAVAELLELRPLIGQAL